MDENTIISHGLKGSKYYNLDRNITKSKIHKIKKPELKSLNSSYKHVVDAGVIGNQPNSTTINDSILKHQRLIDPFYSLNNLTDNSDKIQRFIPNFDQLNQNVLYQPRKSFELDFRYQPDINVNTRLDTELDLQKLNNTNINTKQNYDLKINANKDTLAFIHDYINKRIYNNIGTDVKINNFDKNITKYLHDYINTNIKINNSDLTINNVKKYVDNILQFQKISNTIINKYQDIKLNGKIYKQLPKEHIKKIIRDLSALQNSLSFEININGKWEKYNLTSKQLKQYIDTKTLGNYITLYNDKNEEMILKDVQWNVIKTNTGGYLLTANNVNMLIPKSQYHELTDIHSKNEYTLTDMKDIHINTNRFENLNNTKNGSIKNDIFFQGTYIPNKTNIDYDLKDETLHKSIPIKRTYFNSNIHIKNNDTNARYINTIKHNDKYISTGVDNVPFIKKNIL